MTDEREMLGEALMSMVPDLDGQHKIEPTVLVLGDVPTYEDLVPDMYADHISGLTVDEYKGHPIVQFGPRYAHKTDGGLLLGDGHGGDGHPDLPPEFEHEISRDDYVVAVIFQNPEGDYDDVRVTSIGNAPL